MLLRPEPVVEELLQHAALDPRVGQGGQAVAVKGGARYRRVGGIAADRDRLAGDLLSDLVSPAGSSEEAAPLVGLSGLETPQAEKEER